MKTATKLSIYRSKRCLQRADHCDFRRSINTPGSSSRDATIWSLSVIFCSISFAVSCRGRASRWKIERINSTKSGSKKKKISLLTLGRGFPSEFVKLIEYARGLEFDERPDYKQWTDTFRNLFRKGLCKRDGQYEWDRQRMNVRELALANHPFVCGNSAPLSKWQRGKMDVDGSKEYEDQWGGKKHHKMCAQESA